MPLYGGIDLHANNSVVVLLNEQDQVIYQRRLVQVPIKWLRVLKILLTRCRI
jgi:hypothetical protein